MAAFNSRHRRGGRWWMIGTTLAAAAAFMVVFVAASGANLAGSSFEGNDGNLIVNTTGNTDWANVAGLNTGIDKPSGSTDNSFGQGTKEDNAQTTVVTGSIPPNKNDLTRFYEASELGANNHNYLYLAWERLVNIGNANLDFEINQSATAGFTSSTTGPVLLNRPAGDVRGVRQRVRQEPLVLRVQRRTEGLHRPDRGEHQELRDDQHHQAHRP